MGQIMITITLPWPDACLWPNRSNGAHWTTSSMARAIQRDFARIQTQIALDGLRPSLTGARLCITFHPPTRRRYDLQNVFSALKGACDGIADCLGTDDSTFDPIELKRGEVVQHGSVVVEVFFR